MEARARLVEIVRGQEERQVEQHRIVQEDALTALRAD